MIVRPFSYTREIGDEIIRRFAGGETIRQICVDPDMPARSTVYYWIASRAENRSQDLIDFQRAYEEAKSAHAMAALDECIDISDDNSSDVIIQTRKDGSTYETINSEFVQRSKLRVEARMRRVEKIAPHQFGNSIQLTGPDGGPIRIDDSEKAIARRIAFALAVGMQKQEGDNDGKHDEPDAA